MSVTAHRAVLDMMFSSDPGEAQTVPREVFP